MSIQCVIKLLPDSIANKIAAGEVIQRPASAVKELLENSIDAGADEITLILKDSGKSLIQVNDNGSGMSEPDARMCFERHATSKVREAEDLYSVRTKGFRGEALASIAAVAQVELITSSNNSGLGTKVTIEGGHVKKQENVQSEKGTKIIMKNLYFNIPARRKFLKSDLVELRHCVEEFNRLALAHPEIEFTFVHNGNIINKLVKSGLKQRIINLIGKNSEKMLLPVEQDMQVFVVKGFIGNVEMNQKSKSNQYIFVNKRYIKSNYLNHAITSAYSEFNSSIQYPVFFLDVDVDPHKIDVNIHPTKQEIKFEDERLIYNYLKVAIKHVLGKYVLAPQIDFKPDDPYDIMHSYGKRDEMVTVKSRGDIQHQIDIEKTGKGYWEEKFDLVKSKKIENVLENYYNNNNNEDNINIGLPISNVANDIDSLIVFKKYLIIERNDQLVLIDIKAAKERVLFEKILIKHNRNKSTTTKQLLFPISFDLDINELDITDEYISDLNRLGIISKRLNEKLIINEVPEYLEINNIRELIEESLKKYLNDIDYRYSFDESFSKDNALISVKKDTRTLSRQESRKLILELFECENVLYSPSGEKCAYAIDREEIKKLTGILKS